MVGMGRGCSLLNYRVLRFTMSSHGFSSHWKLDKKFMVFGQVVNFSLYIYTLNDTEYGNTIK